MLRDIWRQSENLVKALALAGVLAVFGFVLGWDLLQARLETEISYREWRDADQELESLLEENQRLERELHALQNDPVYIESVLRQWRMARPGETVLVGEP